MKVFDFVVSRFLDVLLIAVAAVWVFGVDYYPILQWLGFPMLGVAIQLWVVYSSSFDRFVEWCEKHIKEGDDESK